MPSRSPTSPRARQLPRSFFARRWTRLLLAAAILLPSLWLLAPSNRHRVAGPGSPGSARADGVAPGRRAGPQYRGGGSLFDDEPDLGSGDGGKGWLTTFGLRTLGSPGTSGRGNLDGGRDADLWMSFEESVPLSVYEGGEYSYLLKRLATWKRKNVD